MSTIIRAISSFYKHRMLLLSFSSSIVLLGLTLFSLSACQPTRAEKAEAEATVLHRLAVIEMLGTAPSIGIVVHPTGYAYVINDGTIGVFDGPNLVKLITETRRLNAFLHDFEIHPKTGQLYVVDRKNDALLIVEDTELTGVIQNVGKSAFNLAIHPDTGYIYVTSALQADGQGGPGRVSIISGTEVIARQDIGWGIGSPIVNPVDGRVYIAQGSGSALSGGELTGMLAILEGTELLTMTNPGPIPIRAIPYIDVNERTGEIYMGQNLSLVLYRDPTGIVTQTHIGQRELRHSMHSITVDSKTGRAYISSWIGPPSYVVVMEKNEVIAEIPVGFDPYEIAVDTTHDLVYVPNRLSDTISVISGTEVIETHSTGGMGPAFVGVDEERGYVYVVNTDSASVAVFGFDPNEVVDEHPWWRNIFSS